MSELPNDIPLEFTRPKHEAIMNVLLTGTLLKRTARGFFRTSPIREAEFNLLMVLHHSDSPLSQKDLSERLLVDKSNITALIDRLQKEGLILRNPVDGDRRRYDIVLTDQGIKCVNTVEPAYQALVSEVMNGLSEAECATLVRLTRKVRHGLRTADASFPETEG
jgi:DNA-binding MarR family transcriptional regulator